MYPKVAKLIGIIPIADMLRIHNNMKKYTNLTDKLYKSSVMSDTHMDTIFELLMVSYYQKQETKDRARYYLNEG